MIKKKKKTERKHRDRQRITFELSPTQKKAMEIIREATGLELTLLTRYAVSMLIERYTLGHFDYRACLKLKTFAGRRKKQPQKDKVENEG
jgi:hypothetical protein